MNKHLISSIKYLSVASLAFGCTAVSTTFVNPVTVSVLAKAKQTTLGSGEFTVGKDIKPGRYTITSQGGSGNVTSDDDDLNIILGDSADDDMGQVDSYTTTLTKGSKIKIDGIESTLFTPTGHRNYKTTLGAGHWVVGKDIKPGRYVIKAMEGNGNLTSDDGDINEILGTKSDSDLGQVTKTTQTLHRGEVLNSELEQIQLVKK